MLTNIVRKWLATLSSERDLDAPLMAYLGAARFTDVHLTHGPNEIGKNIIGKKVGPARTVQYTIQSKRGNIGTNEWRAPLRGQMWEAVRLGISHPAFDPDLPRQGVLVLSGRLVGGTQEQIDLFNQELVNEGRLPIEVWHEEALVARFSSVDPSSVYPSDKAGYLGCGQFFSIYGVALDGRLTPRNIERHSRNWLSETYNATSLLIPAVEAATLANALERARNLYGTYQARLALARVCLDAAFHSAGPDEAFFSSVATEAIADSIIAAERFSDRVWDLREGAREKKLLHVVGGSSGFLSYPLLCTQVGETLALSYFGSTDETKRQSYFSRLTALVTVEPGISNVFSDNQAVSVVMICRALADGGEIPLAKRYLRAIAYQMLNLYANRLGMASVTDDERSELDRLVGIEFPEIRPPQRHASFMATAVVDLCAYLGERDLYEKVVNDLRFIRMTPIYFRPLDSSGQFRLDAEDVAYSVNVEFEPTLSPTYAYAPHLKDEPRTFKTGRAIWRRGLYVLEPAIA
jgi:hypothetical protein